MRLLRVRGDLPLAVRARRCAASAEPEPSAEIGDIEAYIQNARRVEYSPLSDALLVNPAKPREAPAEEFRTLRTRLNHLQTLQPLHTLVVTSASPAEGKSFTAANLALTQAQLPTSAYCSRTSISAVPRSTKPSKSRFRQE